ncbi:hypothetical protein [Streptomyces sp. NPDC093223]|uniref:hypothetical protein n=1 Tax=Streptomyces sp. NPDC093223 TaxID=3366033 RepID=UPI0037F81D08
MTVRGRPSPPAGARRGRRPRDVRRHGGTITTGYDRLGRVIAYTDADGGTTTNYTYDSADRPTGTDCTYDAFGRTTAKPGGVAMGYYDNDLIRQETVGTKRQTWQLDGTQRIRSWTVETGSGSTWTTTASKVNRYDC